MRKRSRARVAGAVALAAASGACLFPSLDGVSGATGDAGADAGADATVDSPSDAPGADAVADAGSDARPFSCTQVDAAFCDDFDDEDGSTFSHWSLAYVVGGGTATRGPSDASAPFAALFTTPSTAGTAPYALLHREFSSALTSSAHLAFDLRVEKFPSSAQSYFSTGGITLSTSNGSGVGLDIFSKGSLFQETVFTDGGSDYPTLHLAADPPLGKWIHVDVIVSFAQSVATAQVLFDGTTVLAPTNLDPRMSWDTPEITIGETYVDPANDGCAFSTDNVTFDFE